LIACYLHPLSFNCLRFLFYSHTIDKQNRHFPNSHFRKSNPSYSQEPRLCRRTGCTSR